MRIDKVWIVTRASKLSTLRDIVFEADLERITLQVRGGLSPDDIVSVWTEEKEAIRAGAEELDRVKGRVRHAEFERGVVDGLVSTIWAASQDVRQTGFARCVESVEPFTAGPGASRADREAVGRGFTMRLEDGTEYDVHVESVGPERQ